ncbi:MAG: D-alanyl-D-alanine carboxypeptidase/D-alanyl-D-alanine-endopeptidase [Cytophagaceae bacterium]|nr:D-alanyl-D-alanine carboxypeptidase/D-alanyl-D-alanine-endopeptidase [Cytophagaceae bacterium]
MNRNYLKVILFFFFFSVLYAVNAQDSPALTKLKDEVKKISNDPLLKYGQVGFSFRSNEAKIIFESNADKSLIPASNLKLLTTATALKVLGQDYKFETSIAYDGEIINGVLTGNIYIEGGGDPTLGSDRIPGNPEVNQLMISWVDKIKSAGIKKIAGKIIGDQTIFDKNVIPNQWIWTDIGNYYGAGASGLNINENLYKIYFKPGKLIGDSASVIRTEPFIPFLSFDNAVKTGAIGSGDNAYIYGSPYTNYRYLSGTIPMGVPEFSIKGSVPDPAYLIACLLYNSLKDNGIVVDNAPENTSDNIISGNISSRKIIHTHQSPALKEIIKYTNVYSINLYAEALLKILAVKKGLPGTSENGVKTITDYWTLQGMDVKGMFLYDGSGLSPRTSIRATQLTKLMHYMSKDSSFAVFLQSLPVAGQSGTISKFCKGTKAENNVSAKSGSLTRVICFTGYVKAKNGSYNSFSILINNFEGTTSQVIPKIEKIVVLLTEF